LEKKGMKPARDKWEKLGKPLEKQGRKKVLLEPAKEGETGRTQKKSATRPGKSEGVGRKAEQNRKWRYKNG